ncbi:MAG TPA: hypothetical protein P5565_14495 [Bacteroidia bacterium]|jgi:hypothetical protein|nr:hypothetical protein [Bacteroidia bacterium]
MEKSKLLSVAALVTTIGFITLSLLTEDVMLRKLMASLGIICQVFTAYQFSKTGHS